MVRLGANCACSRRKKSCSHTLPGPAFVVVARDGYHRYARLPYRAAGTCHGRLVSARGVEEVACDQNELSPLFPGDRPYPFDCVDACLPHDERLSESSILATAPRSASRKCWMKRLFSLQAGSRAEAIDIVAHRLDRKVSGCEIPAK